MRFVAGLVDAVDVAQELEAVDDREVPPELRALAEHDADARDVLPAILERDQSVDFDAPGVGHAGCPTGS